ncbi:uncharacterized protein MYCFIDRAFT_210971 [Pseudocercospora fijiensis CIRAD86]|uniref:Prion-inhibition and propagation HeLo domain-containing protein n=1 Tax=Pseudocercospora fijiensis (strain CIRAD86) TaxID=383855 RepID=M2Z4P9_PSEFD|nr:uncharacterized protein MYCFIDRAFT_210971 [Pseudocercospora fijiensis CIRAD86]EME84760.1 hypothetical protein MYCFIDRAFT_210971 [Pseudocercospora fijiensis CIRAD86]
MAQDKTSAEHNEGINPAHEALLTGAIALASLFSTCVEAFGLIHPSHKWDKDEQLLLTRLGLQQARLLIWGAVVGVSSPPAAVTNRAVPRHPSAAYPDLKEPTFFDTRDPRLDDPEIRTTIEQTLSAIVDRSSAHSREEMMAKFGLKPPKRLGGGLPEPAMDSTRLEAFREKYELLREVAESYARINTRRNNSLIHTSWQIADVTKFGVFIQLTQEKVDYLIELLNVKEQIDRAMRMDIRIFGWHIIPDRQRSAMDISKLRLLQEICQADYPEYLVATQQALDNISREARENAMTYTGLSKQQQDFINPDGATPKATNGQQHHNKKRPGLLKLFKSFGKSSKTPVHSRSVSGPSLSAEDIDPPRAMSDVGPAMTRIRSKSVGAELDIHGELDEDLRNRLEQMTTHTSEPPPDSKYLAIDSPVEPSFQPIVPLVNKPVQAGIIRHDQYQGIGRVETKDLHQADY